MAVDNTYQAIATQTLGSAAASVTFSSITGTYTDLVLVSAGVSSSSNNDLLQFNGDTGSNYSWTALAAYGSGASPNPDSFRGTSTSSISAANGSTIQHNKMFQIQNYSNTTTYKTTLVQWSASLNSSYAGGSVFNVGLWRNTAAITSITLSRAAGDYNTGSTFTLYGIKAA